MPDFSGLDKASALQLAEIRNLDLEFYGFGVVTKQSISPGTAISGKTSLRLQFEAPTYAE
jgi:hypothetical protein